MTSLTSSQPVTVLTRKSWGPPPLLPTTWGATVMLLVVVLVLGAATTFMWSRETTIADQAAIMRQQAVTLAHYQRTSEALSRTADDYAARLLMLSNVVELDRAIIETHGQLQAQQQAVAAALLVGSEAYVQMVMVEHQLQRHLDDLGAQRQMALEP